MFPLLQTTFIQSGLKWRDCAPQACTRTILYHSHAWGNEDDGFINAQHWGCSQWSKY